MGRYPPFPSDAQIEHSAGFDVEDCREWAVVCRKGAVSLVAFSGKELGTGPAYWHAPHPGLFDVSVHSVHRQGSLREQDIPHAP